MPRRFLCSLALGLLLPVLVQAEESACIFKAGDLEPLFGELRAEPYSSKGPLGGARCEYRLQRASVNVQVSPKAGKTIYKKAMELAKNDALVHKEVQGVGDAAYYTDTGGVVLTGTRMIAVANLRQAAGRKLTDEESVALLKLMLQRATSAPPGK